MTNGFDCLKTGRRVRCNGGPWMTFGFARLDDPNGECNWIERSELEKDIWESEPAAVSVTREKLAEAWNGHVTSVLWKANDSTIFRKFARALGLGDES